MPKFNLFSRRQKIIRGEVPDIYQYDNLPKALRVQIVQIISDTIGTDKGKYSSNNEPLQAYKFIHDTVCHEYGIFTLGNGEYGNTYAECVLNHILKETDIEKVLDVIELTFRYIEKVLSQDRINFEFNTNFKLLPEDAIEELNFRLKEHGIGYQYTNGEIIRLDSEYIHSEVVKPVLKLLQNKKFKGANEEYLNAHEHYRHGRNKECLNECLKSFESVMKIICKENKWNYQENDTSKKLIEICFQNNLVPIYIQNQFTSLRSLLESGIPTVRNKLGGHGQGQDLKTVDNKITRYALNLTGANIIFLMEQSGLN